MNSMKNEVPQYAENIGDTVKEIIDKNLEKECEVLSDGLRERIAKKIIDELRLADVETIGAISFKTGDSVFWLDSDGDILEHTYIGRIEDIAILSGEQTERGINKSGYPTGGLPLLDKDIQNKIINFAKQNKAYNPYPVCFADVKNLYGSKQKAELALEELLIGER